MHDRIPHADEGKIMLFVKLVFDVKNIRLLLIFKKLVKNLEDRNEGQEEASFDCFRNLLSLIFVFDRSFLLEIERH